MSYEEFVGYHEENPDLDNKEYYEKFPDVNPSTIRSWKSRAVKTKASEPNPESAGSIHAGYEEQTKHYIQMLLTQTGAKAREFEGIDDKSKIRLLKNRLRLQKEEEKKKKPTSSSGSILPLPRPIGQSNKKFGLDEYIEFDGNLNEIRMEIPMDVLMNPEENKKLRKIFK